MSSLVVRLDGSIALLPFWNIFLIYLSVLLVVVFLAIWRKWLTTSGLVGAFVLGFIVLYLGGFSSFLILLFFFLSSSLLSKLKRAVNKKEKKGNKRDLEQVLANGIPCLIGLFLTRRTLFLRIGLIGFSSSLAEATSDTWSSVFGIMSKKEPVSIVTFTKVPRGLSGGVTVLGLLCGLLGSFLVASLHSLIFTSSIQDILIIASSGFLGSIIDSFLGATVQEHFRDSNGLLTEKEEDGGIRYERVRGIPGFNNDSVNFCSGILSLSLSLLLSSLIK